MNELAERLSEPTPKFFKKLRNIAVTLGIIGGAILASPITLPAIVVTIGGYFVVAGTVGASLAQTTSTIR